GTPCEQDGDLCTIGESCYYGTCRPPTGPVVCAPLDACHVAGVCDRATGSCSSPPAPDGTLCGGGTCAGGVCMTDDGGSTDGAPPGGGDAGGADGSPPGRDSGGEDGGLAGADAGGG